MSLPWLSHYMAVAYQLIRREEIDSGCSMPTGTCLGVKFTCLAPSGSLLAATVTDVGVNAIWWAVILAILGDEYVLNLHLLPLHNKTGALKHVFKDGKASL